MGTRWKSKEQWVELAVASRYSAHELARLCGISVRQLQRQFRTFFGRSPQNWLNEQRLAAAAQRLLDGEQVKKVAFDFGFKQASHFCRHFKSAKHMTPSEFASLETPEELEMSLSDN